MRYSKEGTKHMTKEERTIETKDHPYKKNKTNEALSLTDAATAESLIGCGLIDRQRSFGYFSVYSRRSSRRR